MNKAQIDVSLCGDEKSGDSYSYRGGVEDACLISKPNQRGQQGYQYFKMSIELN